MLQLLQGNGTSCRYSSEDSGSDAGFAVSAVAPRVSELGLSWALGKGGTFCCLGFCWFGSESEWMACLGGLRFKAFEFRLFCSMLTRVEQPDSSQI